MMITASCTAVEPQRCVALIDAANQPVYVWFSVSSASATANDTLAPMAKTHV